MVGRTILCLAGLGVLSACGGGGAEGMNRAGPGENTSAAPASGSAPHGQVIVGYDQYNKKLSVDIQLSGLARSSSHPADLRLGSCVHPGVSLYTLKILTADQTGAGESYTDIKPARETGIPDRAWYVVVHNGPGLDPADQLQPIACVDIANPGHEVSVTSPL
jgi:hypothetical protein